jgi:hypothetical protein
VIRDLETRLAAVLSARLPAPFANRVVAAPADGPPGPQPRVVVGVRHAERLAPDLGNVRDEVVPGAAAPRRVLRLACTIGAAVQPAANQGRAQQVAGVDALLYALDAPDLRSAAALAGPADPGFLLDGLELVGATFDPVPGAEAFGVTLLARGLFWPVGVPGQTGPRIVRVQVREGLAPVSLTLPPEGLVAGGPGGAIVVGVDGWGTLDLREGQPPAAGAFGAVALRVDTPDGAAGKGTLDGGAVGDDPRVRIVNLTGGMVTVTYTPPAEPVVDELVVALAHGGSAGAELARVPLVVEA